jgi:hypothetical protein
VREGLRDAGVDLNYKQVKQFFKEQFGESDVIPTLGGGQCEILKSTADYTTIECERAMERARAHFAPWFPLPFPNEGGL